MDVQDTGIYIETNNARVTVNGGTIKGKTAGIRNLGASNIVNITDGYIYGSYAIYDNKDSSRNWSTYNITGGTIKGTKYGINLIYATVNISDALVETTSSNTGEYAISVGNNTTLNINSGAVIRADRASGIYKNGTLTMTDGEIIVNSSNGYGIYNNAGTLTMNGGSITTNGGSSNSIYLNNSTLNLNGGSITSKNRGITTADNTNTKTLNIYGGNILAVNYGIYQNQSTTLKLGDSFIIEDASKTITLPKDQEKNPHIFVVNTTKENQKALFKDIQLAFKLAKKVK